MNLIYEACHDAKFDMRTDTSCLSSWSNQGLIAYTVERGVEGRHLMELRIFNSEQPWEDYVYSIRVGRTVTSLTWSQMMG